MTITDEAASRIHDLWHRFVTSRDLDGLMTLYHPDAVLESPLIAASQGAAGAGVLRGRTAIADFFDRGFAQAANGLGRWYRTGTFHTNGRQVVWEYPRETPDGDQIDLVEVIDIADGLILRHRVYWGWVGFHALTSVAQEATRRAATG